MDLAKTSELNTDKGATGAGKQTRREMLRSAGKLTLGGAAVAALPAFLMGRDAWGAELRRVLEQEPAQGDRLTAFRAQMGGAPIASQKLGERLTMLSGPGGNVVVLDGADGKLIVDNFVAPAGPKLKDALAAISNAPVKTAIDTHWHFDHTDNNAMLHEMGAAIVAHENTKARMSEKHHVPVLELDCPGSPAAALPTKTFADRWSADANGEHVMLIHVEPAHTDTDIIVGFQRANVVHCGDLYFSRTFPFIDAGTGGKLAGMIAAANKILTVCDANTKVVPGHGPLSTAAELEKYRDMLAVVLERTQKLKAAGKSVEEAIAAKPLVDLEAEWGKGMIGSDLFMRIAYLTV